MEYRDSKHDGSDSPDVPVVATPENGWKCPACGHDRFTLMRPLTISFAKDRVCRRCFHRTAGPIPRWAVFVFLACGLPLIAFAGFLVFLSSRNLNLITLCLAAGLGMGGILAVWFGAAASSGQSESALSNPVFKAIGAQLERFILAFVFVVVVVLIGFVVTLLTF